MMQKVMSGLAALTLAASPALAQPQHGGSARAASGGANPSLSTQLAQSNGTIQPPRSTDPGMAMKPTQHGTMPVITPRQKNGAHVVAK